MLATLWNTILFEPIHNLLLFFYINTGSLGISVVLIIIAIRLLITPMIIRQYSDTKKLMKIRPKLNEIQEKFKNDPQKLTKAQQELYKEIGYNPIGCFVNFIVQLPIIIALYQSVLTFTKYSPVDMPNLYPFIHNALQKLGQTSFNTTLFSLTIMDAPSQHMDFNNLAASFPYIILLVLLAISNFVPSFINMKYINPQPQPVKKKKTDLDEPDFQETFAASMNNSFLYIMPLMLTVSMYTFPVIIGVYIILQNIIGIVQQVVVKILYDKYNPETAPKQEEKLPLKK